MIKVAVPVVQDIQPQASVFVSFQAAPGPSTVRLPSLTLPSDVSCPLPSELIVGADSVLRNRYLNATASLLGEQADGLAGCFAERALDIIH